MKMSSKYTDDAIKEMTDQCESKISTMNDSSKKYWFLARPYPYHYGLIGNIKKRIQFAWLVFTGKADVVVWIDQ